LCAEAPHGSGISNDIRPLPRKRSQVVLSDGRVASVKVRNHVNPLLPRLQKPVPVPEGGAWDKVFADLSKPIVLDLGCAKGRFCLEGAKRFPEFNWLGVEIREPLVVRANEIGKEQGLDNLHFIFGNASAGIVDLLKSLPEGRLQEVTVQCPDPCFKKKHQKRRMVTNRLVKELGDHMCPGSVLFVQSDVEQVAMQMVDTIASSDRFGRVERLPPSLTLNDSPIDPLRRLSATRGRDYKDCSIGGGEWELKGAGAEPDGSYRWLEDNPLGLMSERESSTISRGLPMFRALFRCRPREDEPKADDEQAETPKEKNSVEG